MWACERLEPDETYQANLRNAVLCCTISNQMFLVRQLIAKLFGNKDNSKPPHKVKDFMLDFISEIPEYTNSKSDDVQDWKSMLETLKKIPGMKVKKRRPKNNDQ